MQPNIPTQNSSALDPVEHTFSTPFFSESATMRLALRAPMALLACSFLAPLSAIAQNLETNTPPENPNPSSTVPFFGTPQPQPASASGYAGEQPAAPFAGTSQLAVAPPVTPSPSALSAGLVHWGFIHIYPFVSYDISYGNNLQSSQGQHADTLINVLTPGVFIALGNHWTLNYAPALRFYSSPQFRNGVDQIVNLVGTTTYQDWTLSLSQAYDATSQPLIETASQLDQEVYSTTLHAGHNLGSQLFLDLNIYQNFRYIDQGQQLGFQPTTQSLEWSTMNWINYQFAPRLSAGVGLGFTYDDVSPGPDMTSEQFQGRISWAAFNKITFAASGGVDYRQFLNSPVPDLLSPLFSGSVQYHLFTDTTLSLVASSTVSPSYYQNALSQSDSVTANLHQKLLKNFFLDVSGGYNSTSYHQTTSVINTTSANNYESTSFNIRLSTVFFKRISASLYFQQNFIGSNSGGAAAALYNYNTKQGGLSLGYHF